MQLSSCFRAELVEQRIVLKTTLNVNWSPCAFSRFSFSEVTHHSSMHRPYDARLKVCPDVWYTLLSCRKSAFLFSVGTRNLRCICCKAPPGIEEVTQTCWPQHTRQMWASWCWEWSPQDTDGSCPCWSQNKWDEKWRWHLTSHPVHFKRRRRQRQYLHP